MRYGHWMKRLVTWMLVLAMFGSVATAQSSSPESEIARYTELINQDAANVSAYFGRGNAHYALGQYENAVEDYGSAIGLNPEYEAAYGNRALANYQLGAYHAAIADCAKALSFNTSSANTYYIRGLCYQKLGQHEQAVEDFEKTLELKPDDESALTQLEVSQAHVVNTAPIYVEWIWSDSSYQGQVVDGEFDGFGVYRAPDGVIYIGELSAGKMTGVGINIYPEGHKSGVYHRSGTFVRGKADGSNAILSHEGVRSEADYINGEIQVESKTITTDTHEWKSLALSDGRQYMGEVLDGTAIPNGYGVMTEADGGVYAGVFANGEREGQGIYMDQYHNAVSGLWAGGDIKRVDRTIIVDGTKQFEETLSPESANDVNAYRSVEDLVEEIVKSVYIVQAYNELNLCTNTGSGFVAFNNTTFITNHHVIAGCAYIVVTSDEGDQYTLDTVLYASEEEDIAILRFPAEANARPLSYNLNDQLKRGQQIIAIGSPRGIRNTVSLGNVSGFSRTNLAKSESIQFTAPISPGSSGGALFNMDGEVVGVVYSLLEDAQNINYAVPIALVDTMVRSTDFATQTLAAFNGCDDPYPTLSNLRGWEENGCIALAWDAVAEASLYVIHSTTPESQQELDIVGRVEAGAGKQSEFVLTSSSELPDFTYIMFVGAYSAEGTLIAVSPFITSLTDLRMP